MVTASVAPSNRRTVRVWFGRHVIAQHTAEQAFAERYESAMRRRFAGLVTTNEPVGSPATPPARAEGQ